MPPVVECVEFLLDVAEVLAQVDTLEAEGRELTINKLHQLSIAVFKDKDKVLLHDRYNYSY